MVFSVLTFYSDTVANFKKVHTRNELTWVVTYLLFIVLDLPQLWIPPFELVITTSSSR